MNQIIQWVGAAYLALSALVAFLAALGAILPGAAGAWCARAAITAGKAVAAVGELRGASPKPPSVPPVILGALLLALGLSSCAWWQRKQPVLTRDGAQVAACVIAHYGEPAEQVAAICAVDELQLVLDIFSAQRAAMARAASSGAPR